MIFDRTFCFCSGLWDPGRSKSDIFEHTLTDTGGVRSCCPSQVQWCVPVWCVCVCVCVCPRFSVALLVVSLNVSLLVPFGRTFERRARAGQSC